MKAAQLTGYEGPKAVVIRDISAPQVAPHKMVVEVFAASVNPIDWKIGEGYLQEVRPLPLPATLGGDFSGVVLEVGHDVKDFKKDDEVYGYASVLSGGSGAFAEFELADMNSVAPKPIGISHTEAAVLPLVGISALQALTEYMRLSNGEKILIHGGAGGIGSVAIQIAKNIGAQIATTVSSRDMDFAKSLGANKVIDYKSERFDDILRDYDAVFDNVGGETYERSFKVLKRGGVIVSMLEKPREDLMKNFGVDARLLYTRVTRERLERLTSLVEARAVKVHIDKTFPLDKTREALLELETKHPRGKIAVVVH